MDDNGFYSIITNGETISNNFTYVSYAFDNYFIFKNEEGFFGLLDIYNGTKIEPDHYTFMLKIDGKNAIEAVDAQGVGDIYSSNLEKVLSIPNAVIEEVDENYTIIHSNSQSSYINKDGQVVSNLEVFQKNSIFAFEENGRWGYKDKNGKVVVEPSYDFALDVNEFGFAGIISNGNWGVIDSKGKIVKTPTFQLDAYYLPKFVGEYLLELSDTYHCLELE